jgi:hypothetical protein
MLGSDQREHRANLLKNPSSGAAGLNMLNKVLLARP